MRRFETARIAWAATYKHLSGLYGSTLLDWRWGNAHAHSQPPLGMQKPLDKLFNIGPFRSPGAVKHRTTTPAALALRPGL